jgi:hypothetical protein
MERSLSVSRASSAPKTCHLRLESPRTCERQSMLELSADEAMVSREAEYGGLTALRVLLSASSVCMLPMLYIGLNRAVDVARSGARSSQFPGAMSIRAASRA